MARRQRHVGRHRVNCITVCLPFHPACLMGSAIAEPHEPTAGLEERYSGGFSSEISMISISADDFYLRNPC